MILLERQCKTTLSNKDACAQQRCQKRELWTNSMIAVVTQNCLFFFFSFPLERLYLDCFYCIDRETLDILNQRPPELLCILNALSNTRNGNPFQYSCLKISHGQRSLVGYGPCSPRESDTTEHTHI